MRAREYDYRCELRTADGPFYQLVIPVYVDDKGMGEREHDDMEMAQGVFVLDAESTDTKGAIDGRKVACGTALEEEEEPFFVYRVSEQRLGKLLPAGFNAKMFLRFALEATGRWDDLHDELRRGW